MGWLSRLTLMFRKKEKRSVIIVGLENSGKSTLLNRLKRDDYIPGENVPTVGFQTDSFRSGVVLFSCYDMSGQERYRPLWEQCYASTDAIIFVIDSDDRNKLPSVLNELTLLLQNPVIKSRVVPILFFANKMDLPGSLTSVEISAALKLHEIETQSWNITSSDAISGDGVEEGLSWLVSTLVKKPHK